MPTPRLGCRETTARCLALSHPACRSVSCRPGRSQLADRLPVTAHGYGHRDRHDKRSRPVSVAKVIELSARSSESFEKAVQEGIAKAGETIKNIEGAWIKEHKVVIENGEIVGYDVNLKITFVVD